MPKYKQPLLIDISRPLSEQPANLTIPEAAAWLRKTTRTLGHWEAKGLLRITRPAGGNPIVPRSEIERLMREGA